MATPYAPLVEFHKKHPDYQIEDMVRSAEVSMTAFDSMQETLYQGRGKSVQKDESMFSAKSPSMRTSTDNVHRLNQLKGLRLSINKLRLNQDSSLMLESTEVPGGTSQILDQPANPTETSYIPFFPDKTEVN